MLRSTTAGGTLHPELDPQVRRASSPELVALFSELAAGGEPEITPLDAAELEARFAAGDELWLFHRDGRVAHVRWTSSQPVPGPGFALPLGPRERAYRSVVTPPEARRSGVARAASEHVRAALAEEGVEALLMLVNGFNRRFHAGLLRAGHEQVARLRVLTVLGRSWLRVDPATPEHAALLTERGIAIGRFRRL